MQSVFGPHSGFGVFIVAVCCSSGRYLAYSGIPLYGSGDDCDCLCFERPAGNHRRLFNADRRQYLWLADDKPAAA